MLHRVEAHVLRLFICRKIVNHQMKEFMAAVDPQSLETWYKSLTLSLHICMLKRMQPSRIHDDRKSTYIYIYIVHVSMRRSCLM
jgi:hypothetical protein